MNNTTTAKNRVTKTLKLAEDALKYLVADNKKISQYAVEKKAGLSNGALNYNVPEYIEFKKRIQAAKCAVNGETKQSEKQKLKIKNESNLKDKYRVERNNYEIELKKAMGEKLELTYQLFELQKYLLHLEKKGQADSRVIDFKRK
ncbi:MAG: hypothetical protein QM500_08760 [Methylococcales bacterium]